MCIEERPRSQGRRLRILHVIASLAPRYGGPPKVAELAGALAALGHHVEVVTTNIDGRGTTSAPLRVPQQLHGATVRTFPVRAPRATAFCPDLARWLRRHTSDFDVAHVHGLYLFTTLAAAHCCRRAGVPYVMQPHGALDHYHRSHHRGRKALYELLVERRNLCAAAAVRWDSESERRQGHRGIGTPGFVIPPGIPLPDASALRRWRRNPGRLAYVGRLSAKKGLDVLLEAFALLGEERRDATLLLAGPDDEGLEAVLRRRAQALGIADRVLMPGPVYGEEKLRVLREACAVVLPSAAESFGAVAFEALAAGTPAIVTTAVPHHSEIAAAPAGLVVERTPTALSTAMLELLDDSRRVELLGEAGRTLARRYSWEAVAPRVQDMYLQVIRDRDRAAAARHATTTAANGEDDR